MCKRARIVFTVAVKFLLIMSEVHRLEQRKFFLLWRVNDFIFSQHLARAAGRLSHARAVRPEKSVAARSVSVWLQS